MESVDSSSIGFHAKRGDFESWLKMLGEKSLAGHVAELRDKDIPPDELRGMLSSIVETRADRLHKIASSK